MRSFTTLRSTANYAPREVEEHDRECELNHAPHNEKIVLSNVEDNTSGLFNRGGIADLPLLRTLLTICQKS